jgi:hypothetical protein
MKWDGVIGFAVGVVLMSLVLMAALSRVKPCEVCVDCPVISTEPQPYPTVVYKQPDNFNKDCYVTAVNNEDIHTVMMSKECAERMHEWFSDGNFTMSECETALAALTKLYVEQGGDH